MNRNVKIAKELVRLARSLVANGNHTEDNVDKWLHMEYPTEFQHAFDFVTFSNLMGFLDESPVNKGMITDNLMNLDTTPREHVLHELLYRYISLHKNDLTGEKRDELLDVWTNVGFDSVMSELGLKGVEDSLGWRIKGSRIDWAIDTMWKIGEELNDYDSDLENYDASDMGLSGIEFMEAIQDTGFATSSIHLDTDNGHCQIEYGVPVKSDEFYLEPVDMSKNCNIPMTRNTFGSKDKLVSKMKELFGIVKRNIGSDK